MLARGAFWLALGMMSCAPREGGRPRGVSADDQARAAIVGDAAAPSAPSAPITPDVPDGPAASIHLSADPAFTAAPLPTPGPPIERFREQSRITVGKGYLHDVVPLPGDLVATVSGDEATLRVYDTKSKRLALNHPVPGFSRFKTGGIVAWPGSRPEVVAAGNEGILLIDAKSGAVRSTLSPLAAQHIRWSPDERFLVATTSDISTQTSVVTFFERGDGAELRLVGSVPFRERVDALDLTRDNRLLALVHYPSNTVRVLDLGDRSRELFRIQAPRYAADCAFSPNGRWLAVGGEGVFLVDLLNPNRRALYSYVYNNVGRVHFSPSGDTLLASAYDGRIRALSIHGPDAQGLRLELLTELSHGGGANVYGFSMTADGRSLVSSSGDQTIRTFAASPGPQAPIHRDGTSERFYDLGEWAKRDAAAQEPLVGVDLGGMQGDTYLSPAFTSAARPSRIQPGHYDCKVTRLYKLRPCRVERDSEGRTILTFEEGLLHLRGVLYDDGPIVRYEASLLDAKSVIACEGCTRQPLEGIFRGERGSYEGLLTFRTMYDPYSSPPRPPANVKIEEASDRFPMVLVYRRPLEN